MWPSMSDLPIINNFSGSFPALLINLLCSSSNLLYSLYEKGLNSFLFMSINLTNCSVKASLTLISSYFLLIAIKS